MSFEQLIIDLILQMNPLSVLTVPCFRHRECSRLVLGLEFQQCDDSSPQKHEFKAVVSQAINMLKDCNIKSVFVALNELISKGWMHCLLNSIISGGTITDEKG